MNNLTLTNKINKYLIQIIDEYVFPNFDKIFSEIPVKTTTEYTLKSGLTLNDIIIKACQRGYKGFSIPLEMKLMIKYFNLQCNDLIYKTTINDNNMYSFMNDIRDLFLIDIFDLENVFIRSIVSDNI